MSANDWCDICDEPHAPCDGGRPTAETVMTEEQVRRIFAAAILIAADPPAKRGQYVTAAKIYWPRIAELRAALDDAGMDWRR